MSKMVGWLDDFTNSYAKSKITTKKMTKKASSTSLIINKERFPKAKNGDVISFSGKTYRVVNASYEDKKGKGILIKRCADLIGDPMEVATGTAVDYTEGNADAGVQEYANVDPEIQDEDPRDEEVAKFEAEAEETEEAIATEDAIDGTSAATHPNRIIQKIIDKYTPTAETSTNETVIVDEINEEVAFEEAPVEEVDVLPEVTEDDVVEEFDEEVEFVDEDLEYEDEVGYEDEIEEDEDIEIDDENESEEDEEVEASRKIASRIHKKFRDLRK